MEKQREENLDLIRATAVLFVVSVHSLSYIGFYEQRSIGWAYFMASILRVVFITCVPLFMILNGYLQQEKQFPKSITLGF